MLQFVRQFQGWGGCVGRSNIPDRRLRLDRHHGMHQLVRFRCSPIDANVQCCCEKHGGRYEVRIYCICRLMDFAYCIFSNTSRPTRPTHFLGKDWTVTNCPSPHGRLKDQPKIIDTFINFRTITDFLSNSNRIAPDASIMSEHEIIYILRCLTHKHLISVAFCSIRRASRCS